MIFGMSLLFVFLIWRNTKVGPCPSAFSWEPHRGTPARSGSCDAERNNNVYAQIGLVADRQRQERHSNVEFAKMEFDKAIHGRAVDCRAHALAADPADSIRIHPGMRAALDSLWGRCHFATSAGNRRHWWYVGRLCSGNLPDSGVLRCSRTACPSKKEASAASIHTSHSAGGRGLTCSGCAGLLQWCFWC